MNRLYAVKLVRQKNLLLVFLNITCNRRTRLNIPDKAIKTLVLKRTLKLSKIENRQRVARSFLLHLDEYFILSSLCWSSNERILQTKLSQGLLSRIFGHLREIWALNFHSIVATSDYTFLYRLYHHYFSCILSPNTSVIFRKYC